MGTNSEHALHSPRRHSLRPPRRGADDFFRPRHAGRRRNPWLLRLSLDQGLPCRPRRAIGSGRLHAGLQEVLGETAPFNAVNGGQVRILIGSSETMGTGVNAQRRLKALHHLDVPWLPSQIEQREGRIERQGNENEEIELYAYATKRSVDATGWQILERKARFIDAAMSGDRSVRRIEDAGSQANQFALAKAVASGDERLMRKAGIASEIARLERLRDSHFDDQFAIRRKLGFGEKRLEDANLRIDQITADLARRTPTRGDAFVMTVGDRALTERKAAGEALIGLARKRKPRKPGENTVVGAIGGFPILARTTYFDDIELRFDRALKSSNAIDLDKDVTPLGLVSRLAYV